MGEGEGGYHKSDDNRKKNFTRDRKGCLDKNIWYKTGLKRESIQEGYALLFHQIILPMCDVGRSGIRGFPRNDYYCDIEKLSSIYGMHLGLGGAYENKILNIFWMSWFGRMG